MCKYIFPSLIQLINWSTLHCWLLHWISISFNKSIYSSILLNFLSSDHFSSIKRLIKTSMVTPTANTFSKSFSSYHFKLIALFGAIFLQHLDIAHNTTSKYSPLQWILPCSHIDNLNTLWKYLTTLILFSYF